MLRIGIVGGSITGCTAAIALARLGHRVTVFERSASVLKGRGAGIGTPRPVLQSLRDLDMVDADMPCCHVTRLAHIGRTSDAEPYGRLAWTAPFDIELLNWGDLYRSLRRRIPDGMYRHGHEVVDATSLAGTAARLQFADGGTEDCDLVLFADGYRSLGRRLVCPDADLEYRGYVLWRGILPEAALNDAGPLEGTLARLGYPDGHAVVYLVPGPDGSIEKGRRWINWGCYVRVSKEALPELLSHREGRPRTRPLPPGGMRLEQDTRLKLQSRRWFPPYYADIIDASLDSFAQAIYLTTVPRHRRERLCLAGDSGTFLPPFTASGVFKGMHNALDLAAALDGSVPIDDALDAWSARQSEAGLRLGRLAVRLESALIRAVPDFAAMDAAAMAAWWHEASSMPAEMFPPAGG